MSQPDWQFVANLGDVNPLDHGGLFVYIDRKGVYPPEMERVEPDEDGDKLEIHRVCLDRCTYIGGILSDNSFHPDHPAWFAKDLAEVASTMDYDLDELRSDLCSGDALKLACAYRAILDYYGWDNGDAYPEHYTRAEAEERYKEETA